MQLLSSLRGSVASIAIALTPVISEGATYFDITPQWSGVSGSQITVHGTTHATTTNVFTGVSTAPVSYRYIQHNQRIFQYDFGAEPGDDSNTTGYPGFNTDNSAYYDANGAITSITSTGLPGSSAQNSQSVRLQIVSDLQYWTGSGFGAVPDSETLRLNRTITSFVTVGTGTGSLTLNIPLTSAGGLHVHLISTLRDELGGIATPTSGVYMIEARIGSTHAIAGASEKIWLVYDMEAAAGQQGAAANWIQTNLIPEPGAAMLIAGPGLWLLRRRRTAVVK